MKRTHITNIVLGIIAAEAVFQTVQAFADRQVAAGKPFHLSEPPEPLPAPRFLLGEALHKAVSAVRGWIFGSLPEMIAGTHEGREQGKSTRSQDGENRGTGKTKSGTSHRDLPYPDTNGDLQLHGSMAGIAEKLKDPAWAGVLAANGGDVSLTDAERAVPMPNSAQSVGRLDRNPYIGKGMKDHSRDKI